MTKVAELYGLPTHEPADWGAVFAKQFCPFLARKCVKTRKSEPEVTIGTCSMAYGKPPGPVMICPHRFLDRTQIFTDCIHLLTLHEPGNELRLVSELDVPGGKIDYCLVSVRDGKPRDFVGVELQAIDTTGTVWPERQRFLRSHGALAEADDVESNKSFGINWKMTAKTTLAQLNHKIETFEHLSKHLVLVLQDRLLDYFRREFAFGHIKGSRSGDPMHFHAYEPRREAAAYSLRLKERLGTDAAGIATCLGLRVDARMELSAILQRIEAKLDRSAPLSVVGAIPPVRNGSGPATAGEI